VNGAQTVGSLSAASGDLSEQLANAKVQIRIVQIEGAPDGFPMLITRNNNTQNRIDPRNFVALDPEQERLRLEFLVDAIDYEYRQGEIEHSSNNRLGLVEATVALACTADDINLSTQAKREVGRLWEDIDRPPYKRLFYSGQTSENIWKKVKAFRRIDNAINSYSLNLSGKQKNVATHGNRFLAHLLYKKLIINHATIDLTNKSDREIENQLCDVFSRLIIFMDLKYADNYVASLFKNQTKCKELAAVLLV
jgi:hypothetical protein